MAFIMTRKAINSVYANSNVMPSNTNSRNESVQTYNFCHVSTQHMTPAYTQAYEVVYVTELESKA